MKTLVDTNVIIYSLDESSEFHSLASDVINSSQDVIASQTITETYRVITSKVQYKNPYTSEEAWRQINLLTSSMEIIYPTEAKIRVLNSLTLKYKATSYQIYDAMLVALMIQNRIKQIVTNNPKDFERYKEIKVRPLIK